MSQITVDLPEELVIRLQPYVDHIPKILELGLRQFDPEDSGLADHAFVEFSRMVRGLDGNSQNANRIGESI